MGGEPTVRKDVADAGGMGEDGQVVCTRLLPQGPPYGSTFSGYNSPCPKARFPAEIVESRNILSKSVIEGAFYHALRRRYPWSNIPDAGDKSHIQKFPIWEHSA